MQFSDYPADVRARLVDAYSAGVAAGSGGPWLLDDTADTIALIDAITFAYFRSVETWQTARPHWPADEVLPEWLRAEQERAAIADARPPEGWLTRVAREGKP